MLTNQLHLLKMSEGGSMEDYGNKTTKLKNHLLSMGEMVPDKNICQSMLNGLPRSYEGVVTTLSNLDTLLTFDQLAAKLLMEVARQEQRTSQLGDEEALATYVHHANMFQPRGSITPHFCGQFPRPNLRGRGYPRNGYQHFRGGRGQLGVRNVEGRSLWSPFALEQAILEYGW